LEKEEMKLIDRIDNYFYKFEDKVNDWMDKVNGKKEK